MPTTVSKRVMQLTELFDSFLTLSNVHTVGSSYDVISPNVVVGTRDFANQMWKLKQLGITHVLNVCDDLSRTDRRQFDSSNILLAHVSFDYVERRMFNCAHLFRITSSFVRRVIAGGGKILVYSPLGVNQASAVAIAYFVETYRLSVERAALVVAMKRLVKPDDYLLSELVRFSDETLTKQPDHQRMDGVRTSERGAKISNALNLVRGIPGTRRTAPYVKDMRMIIFNLFMGTLESASDAIRIAKNNITHLLVMDTSDGKMFFDCGRYRQVGIAVTGVGSVQSVSNDLDSLVELCVSFIGDRLKNGERVLVVSEDDERLAGTVVAAYIVESHGVSVQEALRVITERRSLSLGIDYVQFLFDYEDKLQRRKCKTLQQVTDATFYRGRCNANLLEHLHSLSFLRVCRETSV